MLGIVMVVLLSCFKPELLITGRAPEQERAPAVRPPGASSNAGRAAACSRGGLGQRLADAGQTDRGGHRGVVEADHRAAGPASHAPARAQRPGRASRSRRPARSAGRPRPAGRGPRRAPSATWSSVVRQVGRVDAGRGERAAPSRPGGRRRRRSRAASRGSRSGGGRRRAGGGWPRRCRRRRPRRPRGAPPGLPHGRPNVTNGTPRSASQVVRTSPWWVLVSTNASRSYEASSSSKVAISRRVVVGGVEHHPVAGRRGGLGEPVQEPVEDRAVDAVAAPARCASAIRRERPVRICRAAWLAR